MNNKNSNGDQNFADLKLSSQDPYVQIVKSCLEFAVSNKASDVHIEPKEDGLAFRVRVNGVMSVWKQVAKIHTDPIVWRAKWLAGLDLSIINKPQDSRATFNLLRTDIRANALPTLYGNKVVYRLLPHDVNFNLANSGLCADSLKVLIDNAAKKQGLLIISGPTGSGKTTTLYGLLNSIDRAGKNICTIEHPVEYRMEGISQVDVSEDNLSFSDAMRAMLRQDPDVILFGEIRDKESAEIAVHAANTGHLVLSTLHTNGATEVIDRLLQLGIDEWSIRSTLILAASQRLVPLLCRKCAVRKIDPKDESYPVAFQLNNSGQCADCVAGISGRTPIIEYIDAKGIQRFLKDRSVPNFKSLYDVAAELAKQGIIDYREPKSFK